MRVSMDFTLIHKAFLVIVKKLNGVLDGDHVLFALVIDFVEHGSQRGRFTGTRWSGHEDEAAGLVAQSLYDQRQSQTVKALDFPRNRAENGPDAPPFIQNVSPTPRQIF